MIKPASFEDTSLEILKNMKHYPWLKDCISAIDWTHIPAVLPTDKVTSYRFERKMSAHSVLTVCSFDMRLTWIWHEFECFANELEDVY